MLRLWHKPYLTMPTEAVLRELLWQRRVFFNLIVVAESSAYVCVAHGTLCNDPSVYIATTA